MDLASIEVLLGVIGGAVGVGGGVWKAFLKGWLAKRRAKKEAQRQEFIDQLVTLREENTQQHAAAAAERRTSEARTVATLERMESKQDHLVQKVDKIEDDVSDVRERIAYVEGGLGVGVK